MIRRKLITIERKCSVPLEVWLNSLQEGGGIDLRMGRPSCGLVEFEGSKKLQNHPQVSNYLEQGICTVDC